MKNSPAPDIEGLILTSPWFSDLPASAIERLIKAAHVKQLKNKEYLFSAGDTTAEIYCLYSGRVRISIGDSEGQVFAITDLEADFWFGEVVLVHSKQRLLEAQAKEDSSILVFPRSVVIDIANQHPLVYRALFHETVKRTRGIYELMSAMLFYPLKSRLAGRLLELAKDHGEKVEGGIYLNVNLNQNDFARLCFGSRQSVNKILREWYNQDIVIMQDKRYFIKDIQALRDELYGYTGDLVDF